MSSGRILVVVVAAAAWTWHASGHGAPGEWATVAGDQANTRYSELRQITTDNVSRLRQVYSYATGTDRGLEAAPLVVGSTLYLVTPYPNVVHALDLATPQPSLKWKFEPAPDPHSQGVACCDTVNRGLAYANGRLFFNTLDNQTLALDARTGRELWRTRLGDVNLGESMTMAPLVVRGKVVVGNSGGEFGVRGWIAALDAGTGKLLWKAYSTGPDRDVRIGPRFRPHYPQDRGNDLGVRSWPSQAWMRGGGAVWGFLSYDGELNLLYHGTSNPSPWNPDQRPGDNKWTSGIFARDVDTGEAIWFYQFSPHDLHDYDGVNENVLVNLGIGGQRRRVLLHPDRNGYLYVMDRASGEVISARPYAAITTSTGVDLRSGRLQYAPEKAPVVGRVVRNICPASPGAKDWQPSAWSPRTGWLYIPHQNLCQDMLALPASYIPGTPYLGAEQKMYAGPGGHRGEFSAWDPVSGRKRWSLQERFPVWSGALATAGDLVFYGTMEGWFKAVDARTGALRWRFRAPSGIVGQPVSFLGPDGRQYVAITSGVGGWAGTVVAGEVDTRDASAVDGFAHAMADLPAHTGRGGMLHLFALPR